MKHVAEIIGVGTELLLGNTANTDAQLLSEGLSELGIDVYFHTVVGDNPERLRQAVEIAKGRADILITTGGLGPTCDDLTKQTVAACFGRKLVFHEELAEEIRGYFSRRLHAKTMTDNNLQQANLPERCEILRNDRGTAPGCAFEEAGKHVIMLPGPPNECRAMFERGAVPYLRRLSDAVIVSARIRLMGIGESAAEDKLREAMLEMTNPTLAPYAKQGEVMLRATAKAATEQQARAMLEPVVERVREIFGRKVYGVDVDSLEQVLVAQLTARGLTLATAESCTGGLISKRITDIPGSSAVFLGGVAAYSNPVKEALLGVSRETLAEYGAVSEPVARQMAEGARARLRTDLAVGVTGIAGPDADGSGKEVGTVFIALAAPNGTICKEIHAGDSRERVRLAAANVALNLVRLWLLDNRD